jgi:hypothetical protein
LSPAVAGDEPGGGSARTVRVSPNLLFGGKKDVNLTVVR